MKPIDTFYDADWYKKELPDVLKDLNFITPTEIQAKTIPLALTGQNVIGQSKTGTGKTLAFGTPIIDKVNPEKKGVQALVITPTRELCIQVADVFEKVGKPFGINVLTIYGGVSYGPQKEALSSGRAHVVVATPGRLIDLYNQKYLDFRDLYTIVLDEADRMLDMGFFPDIEYIFNRLPKKHVQILLFSATIFQEIMESVNQVTKGNHTIIRVGKNEDEFVIDKIRQEKYLVKDRDEKYDLLKDILRKEKPTHCLIFSNTISGVDFLERRLKHDFKWPVLKITGDVSQKKRERIIQMFKQKKINHLIATDVASRGLDIPNISHVINYDAPQYPENYVHRIGRTGRLDRRKGETRRGKAITLCTQDDLIYMQRIEELINMEVPTIKEYHEEEEWKPRNPFRY